MWIISGIWTLFLELTILNMKSSIHIEISGISKSEILKGESETLFFEFKIINATSHITIRCLESWVIWHLALEIWNRQGGKYGIQNEKSGSQHTESQIWYKKSGTLDKKAGKYEISNLECEIWKLVFEFIILNANSSTPRRYLESCLSYLKSRMSNLWNMVS